MGRGVLLLLVCVLLLAAVVVTRPWQEDQPQPQASMAASTASMSPEPATNHVDEGDGRTVSLGDSAVLVRYPEGYGLAADDAQLTEAGSALSCNGTFDYCIYPGDEVDGAEALGLSVRRRADLGNEADCVLEPTPAFADRLPQVGGAADHATARFGTVEKTEAEDTVRLNLRRLYFDGACFEFVSRVVVEDGQDATAAGQELTAIVDRVALPDGRSGLWSAGR